MQGKVVVRRDAGQIVAGNAVTNIENYVAAHPSRCVLAVAFFFGVSVTLACVAGTLPPSDDSCYYEGRRYSPGALARMGRVEMACIVKGGAASWAHAAY